MSDSPTSRIQTLQAPYCYYAYAVYWIAKGFISPS